MSCELRATSYEPDLAITIRYPLLPASYNRLKYLSGSFRNSRVNFTCSKSL